jgi:type VI secretion system secreted protein VgrG
MTQGLSVGVSMITGLFDSDPNSPMSVKKRAPFELRVGPFKHYELEVLSFRGKERVNDVYRYEVTFATEVDEDKLHTSLFGEPGNLTIKAQGHDPRVIEGLVVSLEGLGGVPGEQGTGRLRYRLEIVPKLWLMKRRRKNRVFQQQSAPAIVNAMLAEVGIEASEVKWRAEAHNYPKLPFVYQRNESDFDFFRRVLADAGIFFYFVHPSTSAGLAVLTFASQPSNTPAVLPAGAPPTSGKSDTVAFDDGMAAASEDDRIYEFGLKKLLRTKALRLHERAVETAASWVGEQATEAAKPPAEKVPFDLDTPLVKPTVLRQERYQVDAGLPLGKKAKAVNDPRMELELARTRRRFLEAQGKSDCRRMGAGYRVKLGSHPIKALDGEYTVIALDAEGTHPDYATDADPVYRNRFRCIPSAYAPLPPRPKARPKLGIELGQVVAHDDIKKVPWLESSPNGYVKVRFRWDIVDKGGASTGMLQPGTKNTSGTLDECAVWVPVMQPWAGAGYGAQFIPREGMDVVIGFLEDQGERPVILGCLYSAANPPPWPGKNDQQKVGIKSQTRAANAGYSEVSIDDTQGKEVLTVTAQTDLNETVNADRTSTVGGTRSGTVTGADSLHVVQARSLTVDGDSTETVGGAATLTVKKALTEAVTGDRTETTSGNHTITTAGATTESITGSAARTVEGDVGDSVAGDYSLRINGTASVVVGEEEAKDGYSDVYVYGDHTIGASGNLRFKSLTSIVFQCGSSIVSMTPDAIQVASPSIAMAGQKRMYLAGAGPALTLSDQAELVGKTVSILSSGASLTLDSGAALYGSTVKFGSDAPPAPAPDSTNPTLPTKGYHLVAKDGSGTAYANKNYSLLVDGDVTQGTTGADGSIQATISASSVLAHLTVWTGAYPEGPRLRWDLALVAKLEPVDSIRGALDRLTNLGYYQGEVGDVLTDDGVVAVQRFQGDNNLPITGAIDAATTSQLSQSHGH